MGCSLLLNAFPAIKGWQGFLGMHWLLGYTRLH